MNKKKYVLSSDDPIDTGINIGNIVFSIGILFLICIISFLIAKYIVNIGIDETPIDTSRRM